MSQLTLAARERTLAASDTYAAGLRFWINDRISAATCGMLVPGPQEPDQPARAYLTVIVHDPMGVRGGILS